MGSLPFLLLVIGVPVAIVALLPAVLVWNRLMRGRSRALSHLYLTPGTAAVLRPALAASHRSTVLGLAAALVTMLVALALAWAPDEGDLLPLAVGSGVLSVAGLGVPALWPSGAGHRPRGVPRDASGAQLDGSVGRASWSLPERRALWAVVGTAGLLGAGLLAAGVVSVPDPSTGGTWSAFPRPSVVDWRYSYDGVPKEIEYTPFGRTGGWPGWEIGTPMLLTTALVAVLFVVLLTRIRRRPTLPVADGPDADDASRFLLAVFGIAVALAGLLFGLAIVTGLAGDVLASVALEPRPQPNWRDQTKPVAYRQPLGLIGMTLRGLWPVLSLAALSALWVAAFTVRELGRARDAARRVTARA